MYAEMYACSEGSALLCIHLLHVFGMDIVEIASRSAALKVWLYTGLKKEQLDAVVDFLSVYNSPLWVWKIIVLCLSPVSRGAPPFSSTRSSNNCIPTEQKRLPYGTRPFLIVKGVASQTSFTQLYFLNQDVFQKSTHRLYIKVYCSQHIHTCCLIISCKSTLISCRVVIVDNNFSYCEDLKTMIISVKNIPAVAHIDVSNLYADVTIRHL